MAQILQKHILLKKNRILFVGCCPLSILINVSCIQENIYQYILLVDFIFHLHNHNLQSTTQKKN